MLSKLKASSFEGYENTDFEAIAPDGKIFFFRLKEVARKKSISGHAHAIGQREPFSLFFQGPPEIMFSQGTIHLAHSLFEGNQVPVFMVAVGADRDVPSCLTYQAVFN